MPAPIIPDDGKTALMEVELNGIRSGANSGLVTLFTNNYTPTTSSVPGSFTAATFGGGSAQATPAATDAGVVPGGVDNWIFGPLTWTATGSGLPVTVYGYYVTITSPITSVTRVLWAQRFDTPQALSSAGQTISFILSLAGNQGP